MNESANNFIEYNLANTNEPNDTRPRPDFSVLGQQYFGINDANSGIFTGGKLRFNAKTAVTSSIDRAFIISDGYILVPYEVRMGITDGYIPVTNANKISSVYEGLKYAVCLKGPHHIFDAVTTSTFGSVQDIVNSSSRFRNIFCNEKLKDRTQEEVYLRTDNHVFDNHRSYAIDPTTRFESNNETGIQPNSRISKHNDAFYERNKHLLAYVKLPSGDYAHAFDGDVESQMVSYNDCANVLRAPHVVFEIAEVPESATGAGDEFDACVSVVYRFMVKLPLASISEAYKNMNFPLMRFDNFNLDLLLNVGQGRITLGATSTANTFGRNGTTLTTAFDYSPVLNVASTYYQPRFGSMCPYIVSSASNGIGSAVGKPQFRHLVVNQLATNKSIVLNLVNRIGWGDSTADINILNFCQLRIPTAMINPAVQAEYLDKNSIKDVFYSDYYLDEQSTNVAGTVAINRDFGTDCNRPIALYIMGFLRDSGDRTSLLHPLSSAGNTVSCFKIRDLHVRVGSHTVYFQDKLTHEHQFLEDVYHGQGKDGGNAVNSVLKSGIITPEMWKTCYGVYKVPLKNALDLSSWKESVKPSINFVCCNSLPNAKFDIVMILEHGKEFSVNIANSVAQRM